MAMKAAGGAEKYHSREKNLAPACSQPDGATVTRQLDSPRMLRPSRALLVAMALAAGCAGETFDLLRPAGGGGMAGSGAGIAGAAGRGGATTGGTGGSKGGTGATAGRGGATSGGTGGRGGTGAFGNGGTGLTSGDGGESGENAGGAGSTDCMTNFDCTASTPYCVPIRNSNVNANHCVACVSGADCGAGENCNFLTNACAPVCFTWEQCPLHLPFCEGELGVCVECTGDSHCGNDVCLYGQCVQCRSAFDCPLDAPVCDTASRCVPCTGMFQCGQYRYCDISTGRCEPLGTP